MKKISLNIFWRILICAALVASATAAQAASYNISNSLADMVDNVQAMGPTTLGTGTFVGVGCPPGVACNDVAINGLSGVSFATGGPFSSVSYDGGLLNNLVVGDYLEWTFDTPQNGWGGTFQMALNNGLSFQALDLPEGRENLGWVDVIQVDYTQELDGFLGFSSTEQFGGVRVFQYSTPDPSSYKMTDVSIASAEHAAPVPEPATMLLLGSGLVGLAGYGRKKFFKK